MEPIVLYSRVSTQKQEYKSQFEDLKKWSIRMNFKVVKVFGEKVSGYDLEAERKEFELMKNYVLEHNIKNIGIWEISRLGRSMVRTVQEINYFREKGINIHFKKEGLSTLSDNPSNKLLLSILSSMAEMERDTILERHTRGKISSAMSGKAVSYGILPYGYIKDKNGYLIINSNEEKVIKMIYDMGLKGSSLRAIATHLNSLNIPTRRTINGKVRTLPNGKQVKIVWRQNSVRRILHSPIYKGEGKYTQNETIDGKKIPVETIPIRVPAIITPESWNDVQERFKDNIGYINRTTHEYLLKGKLRCGKCGSSFTAETRNNRGSYYCKGRKDKGINCKNGGFSSELLDSKIWDNIVLSKGIEETYMKDNMSKSKSKETKKQIEYYRQEIDSLEIKLKKNVRLYKDDFITEKEFKKDSQEIKYLMTEYNDKIRMAENSLTQLPVESWQRDLSQILNWSHYETKREFIMKYIDKIVIYSVNETNVPFRRKLFKMDKVLYIEIYTYMSTQPFKMVISSRTKNLFFSDKLLYKDGGLVII